MKRYLYLIAALAVSPIQIQAQTVFCFIDGQIYSDDDCPRDQPAPTPEPEDDSVDGSVEIESPETPWTHLNGRNLVDLDIGANGEIFGLAGRSIGGTYSFFTFDGNSWRQLRGRVSKIEVQPDGSVLGTDPNNRYLEFVGGRWSLLDAFVRDIAVDERGTPIAALLDGSIAASIEGRWHQIATGTEVEAGPGGIVVFRADNGPLQVLSPFGKFVLPGEVAEFSVGADGRIYAVMKQGGMGANEAVTWDFPFGWRSLEAVGVLGVTASSDGTVYAWFEDGTFKRRSASSN